MVWPFPNSGIGAKTPSPSNRFRTVAPVNHIDAESSESASEVERGRSVSSVSDSVEEEEQEEVEEESQRKTIASMTGSTSTIKRDYPPELLASEQTIDELGLPEALLAPLEEEVEMSGPTTLLQANILSEGRTGASLLVQDRSGAETTVAFAMLLLKQLLDRGLVSAGMQPWEGCKDETGEEKKDSEKSGGGGGFFGKRSSEHKKAAGQNQRQLHAVVLARNKEIAVNVTETIGRLGQCIPGLELITLVGGVPVAENVRTLKNGCHIAVGTPGRVRYLMGKGALQSATVRTLSLDSADFLMAPVFQEDVDWIAGKLPESKQVLAFSTADTSAIKPALSALVCVPELRTLCTAASSASVGDPGEQDGAVAVAGGERSGGGDAGADADSGETSDTAAAAAEEIDDEDDDKFDEEVLSPVPLKKKLISMPSPGAVARAADVSAAAEKFLKLTRRSTISGGIGGGRRLSSIGRSKTAGVKATKGEAGTAAANTRSSVGGSARSHSKEIQQPAKFKTKKGKKGKGKGNEAEEETEPAAAAAAATVLEEEEEEEEEVEAEVEAEVYISGVERKKEVEMVGAAAADAPADAAAAADTLAADSRKNENGDYLTVATSMSFTSLTSTVNCTPSPPSLRLRAQRAARAAQVALATQTPVLGPPTLAPCSPIPGPGSSHSSEATTTESGCRSEDSSATSAGPTSQSAPVGDGVAEVGEVREQGADTIISHAPVDSDGETAKDSENIWRPTSGGPDSEPGRGGVVQQSGSLNVRDCDGTDTEAKVSSRRSGGSGSVLGNEADTAAADQEALDLLSPGSFRKDPAEEGEEVTASDDPLLSAAEVAAVAVMEAATLSGRGASSPSLSGKNRVKRAEGGSERGTEEIVVREKDVSEYLEEQQQKQLNVLAATMDLLEGWGIPAVLLAALEADDFRVPTALQASVWSAGRGEYRADLLVHGLPGDETITAYVILILERVWLRYPPPVDPRTAPAWDTDVKEELAADSPAPLDLQALVLTRTRDMAAVVTNALVRLGRGIPKLSVATLVGGTPVAEQSKALAGGCHVAVGTPGRVRFWMKKGVLRPHSAKTLVLDSADWLMAAVFEEDVAWIAGKFPMDKQVLAFSGADPRVIEEGLRELVNSPHMTSIGGNAGSSGAEAEAETGARRESSSSQIATIQEVDDEEEAAALEHMEALAAIENERAVAAAAAAAAVAHAERELRAAEEELRATIVQGESNNGDCAVSPEAAAEAAMAAVARGAPDGSSLRARQGGYRQVQDGQHQGGELAVIRNTGFGAVKLTASGKAAVGVFEGLSGARPGGHYDDYTGGSRGGMMIRRRAMTNVGRSGFGSGGNYDVRPPLGSSLSREIVPTPTSRGVGAAVGGATFRSRVRLSRENQLYGAWCRQSIGGVGAGSRR